MRASQPDSGAPLGGLIAWFVGNPVAANLMMGMIICAGLYGAFAINRTLFPELDIDWIEITTDYPGAAPSEVEQSVSLLIEEAVRELEGIDTVIARSFDSRSMVSVRRLPGFEPLALQNRITAAVDSIANFPAGAERPRVDKMPVFMGVSQIEVHGALDPISMKRLAREVKLDLLRRPQIGRVEMYGVRSYEISIEVSEQVLRKHGLRLEDIAVALRRSSLDLPGGALRTESGEISVRAIGQRYREPEFLSVPLLSRPDGTLLTLGDVAVVRDGLVESGDLSRFNGSPSITVAVLALNGQDVIDLSGIVESYVAEKRSELPVGAELTVWADVSHYLQERLDLMLRNLMLGAVLVFLVLALFIDLKLAFWVMLGVPISFLGAIGVFSSGLVDVSFNLISLFALILVLGIVVDDAIIIGESVTAEIDASGHSQRSVVTGVHRVLVPSTFGVLTSIVAFSPTALVTGSYAAMPNQVGFVVTLCLLFSLLESKWILPAHLAHTRASSSRWLAWPRRVQAASNRWLSGTVIRRFYRPLVGAALRQRYAVLAVFVSALLLVATLMFSGAVRMVLIADTPTDFVNAKLEMVDGTSQQQTLRLLLEIESALREVESEYVAAGGRPFVKHVRIDTSGDRNGDTFVELRQNASSHISNEKLLRLWRERVGELPGAEVLAIGSASDELSGRDIALRVFGKREDVVVAAATDLVDRMRSYRGVYDIRSDVKGWQDEIQLSAKPGAEALGIGQLELATQVRHALHGAEVQRVLRDGEEIRVMARYPKGERDNALALNDMHIRAANGAELPFLSVADYRLARTRSQLTRIDGSIAVGVSAEVDSEVASPSEIIEDVMARHAPELAKRHPGAWLGLDSTSQEQNDMLSFLMLGFIFAMLANYALLAVPLRSYFQPMIVMAVVPFGAIGAVVGHVIMGEPLSFMSLFGVLALSGVIINDSLILTDFINRARREGAERFRAVLDAGCYRLRAILLTSLTTFFGLLPLLLDGNPHVRFVAPMAISLAFGIVFATLITLVLIPCLYIILDDIGALFTARRPTPDRLAAADAPSAS